MKPKHTGQTARFRITIPAETLERYYRGQASAVVVETLDGRRLQFPVRLLREFVGHDGVHGLFEIRFDAGFHCLDLRRIGD